MKFLSAILIFIFCAGCCSNAPDSKNIEYIRVKDAHYWGDGGSISFHLFIKYNRGSLEEKVWILSQPRAKAPILPSRFYERSVTEKLLIKYGSEEEKAIFEAFDHLLTDRNYLKFMEAEYGILYSQFLEKKKSLKDLKEYTPLPSEDIKALVKNALNRYSQGTR